jgi:hypothetical protein
MTFNPSFFIKMPSYSNTVIYKIEHKEKKELVYVGNTTNLIRRKYEHKTHCINEKDKKHHFKVYKMIRDNGGWEAFQVLEIKKFPCNDNKEAQVEEERCRVELNALMNTNRAFGAETKEEYDVLYYESNKEKILDYHKEFYELNKEKIKEQQKVYREANKEKIKERDKKYREAKKLVTKG